MPSPPTAWIGQRRAALVLDAEGRVGEGGTAFVKARAPSPSESKLDGQPRLPGTSQPAKQPPSQESFRKRFVRPRAGSVVAVVERDVARGTQRLARPLGGRLGGVRSTVDRDPTPEPREGLALPSRTTACPGNAR